MGDNRQVCPKCQKLSAGLYCRWCGFTKSANERKALNKFNELPIHTPAMRIPTPTPTPDPTPIIKVAPIKPITLTFEVTITIAVKE